MGRVYLICRLAFRDLQRRRAEALLVLVAIVAATTTLTLGLALRGVTSQPYLRTRSATAGPDVVASWVASRSDLPAGLAQMRALVHATGVTGYGGPYPLAFTVMRAGRYSAAVMAEGRGTAPAAIDQPELTQGSWVSDGGVVVESSFAAVLGLRVGEQVTIAGHTFRVSGIAVTAAAPPYPMTGFLPNASGNPGLIWLPTSAVQGMAAGSQPLSYTLDLKLADPGAAAGFAARYDNSGTEIPLLLPWQSIEGEDAKMTGNEQQVLLVGSWLLGLLAIASVAVITGGRMAEQTRRVGLLKAVGGTPGLIAAAVLAEQVVLALLAAAAGLAIGQATAPLLTSPGAGLVGTAAAAPLTATTIALVAAVALAVAAASAFIPAFRAARSSTIGALAGSVRPPRRRGWLVAMSALLPVPLLLGLRQAARRPRRVLLAAASIAITVSAIVAVLTYHAHNAADSSGGTGMSALANPRTQRVDEVMLIITVALIVLAVINAILITWATVLDARRSSALARALGANAQQVSSGLSAAQLVPAIPGALAGLPVGVGIYAAVSSGQPLLIPPPGQLAVVVAGTLLAMAVFTGIPALAGTRQPVAEILQSELT